MKLWKIIIKLDISSEDSNVKTFDFESFCLKSLFKK